MKGLFHRRPSAALVVAVVALFASFGGSAVAEQAKRMITGKDIAKDAITSHHVKNGSLRQEDLSPTARSSMRGQAGPRGPQGPQGPAGPKGEKGDSGTVNLGGENGASQPGETVLTAAVDKSGNLVEGDGAVGVSVNNTRVTVDFDHNVLNCVPVATQGGSGDPSTGITVEEISTKSITVKTDTSRPVYLAVICD